VRGAIVGEINAFQHDTQPSCALYQGPTLVGPQRIEKAWALAPANALPAENVCGTEF
jgi:hypothetical protein